MQMTGMQSARTASSFKRMLSERASRTDQVQSSLIHCPLSPAEEQLKNGYSPYTGPIIFGSTSFDGSTIYGGGKAHRRYDLKPEEIEDFIFPLIEENESIEPVPAWARKFIVQVRGSLTVHQALGRTSP